MNETEGFAIEPNPQRDAEEWFELFRAGKREEAAAQVAAQEHRSRQATNAAIDECLRARASRQQ